MSSSDPEFPWVKAGARGHMDRCCCVRRRVYIYVSTDLRPLLPAGCRGDGDLITASAKAP
jgi:hypothetical protein